MDAINIEIRKVLSDVINSLRRILTYEEFKKILYEKFLVEDIACFGGLPYQISGRYDTTAMETIMRKMYNEGVPNMVVKIKYFDKEIDKINKISNGDWIDLRASKTVEIKKGERAVVPLGVGMILPEGYEAHVVPRSSTLKNFKVIQGNHIGIIDNSYSGDEDQWMFSAYALEDTIIHKNDRICQFRIEKKQPEFEFEEVEHLNDKSRGGFGSTGIN